MTTNDERRRRSERVQHIDQAALDELRGALERQGSGEALQAIDVLDYVEHLTSAREGLRAELGKANERADGVLAKDFLALYQAAAAVAAWHGGGHEPGPELSYRVEGLALHVQRLAPLYDDVRRSLLAQKRATHPLMIAEIGLGGALRASVYPVDSAHTVRVLGPDGSERIECDHEFVGAPNCVHCGKTSAELFKPGPIERVRPEPAGVDVVSIALGPVLRARVEQLVKTGRLGRSLTHVAQTLFVLGLLDAEGQDPRAHFGEPKQHVSVDGVFVRFALPHEVGDEARREILRTLYAWLHAWLGDDEPLQRTASAALEALPR